MTHQTKHTKKKDSLDCESKKKKTKKNGRIIEVRRKRNSSLSNLISNINRIQNGQMAATVAKNFKENGIKC